jgi:hypothetical protein
MREITGRVAGDTAIENKLFEIFAKTPRGGETLGF